MFSFNTPGIPWSQYHDFKLKWAPPPPHVLVRRVRIESRLRCSDFTLDVETHSSMSARIQRSKCRTGRNLFAAPLTSCCLRRSVIQSPTSARCAFLFLLVTHQTIMRCMNSSAKLWPLIFTSSSAYHCFLFSSVFLTLVKEHQKYWKKLSSTRTHTHAHTHTQNMLQKESPDRTSDYFPGLCLKMRSLLQ